MQDGSAVGLGTGRAVSAFVGALAERARRGFQVRCVATSRTIEAAARDLGLSLMSLDEVGALDLDVDRACYRGRVRRAALPGDLVRRTRRRRVHTLNDVESHATTGILDSRVSTAVSVRPPFRLDYTVAALQRVATNAVEVWMDDGRYLRAFATPHGPVVWEVAQDQNRPALLLRLHGPAGAIGPWRSLLRRVLGLEVDLGPFYATAARVPVLGELAERFRGLRPPRFATLWESLVNTIAFQQLSLASGMAAVGRLVRLCASRVVFDSAALYPFPAPEAVSGLLDADLRACGFSGAKARSLRAAAGAVLDGALREDELERLPNAAVVERLRQVPGVGPWTSSLVLLRGMGRLTSFPMGDSGANRRLRAVFGATDAAPLLATLGDFRGMLYFHLLLSSRYGDRVTVARPCPPSPPARSSRAQRLRRRASRRRPI